MAGFAIGRPLHGAHAVPARTLRTRELFQLVRRAIRETHVARLLHPAEGADVAPIGLRLRVDARQPLPRGERATAAIARVRVVHVGVEVRVHAIDEAFVFGNFFADDQPLARLGKLVVRHGVERLVDRAGRRRSGRRFVELAQRLRRLACHLIGNAEHLVCRHHLLPAGVERTGVQPAFAARKLIGKVKTGGRIERNQAGNAPRANFDIGRTRLVSLSVRLVHVVEFGHRTLLPCPQIALRKANSQVRRALSPYRISSVFSESPSGAHCVDRQRVPLRNSARTRRQQCRHGSKRAKGEP